MQAEPFRLYCGGDSCSSGSPWKTGVANGLGKPIVTHLRDVVEIPEHHPNLNYQIKRPQRGRMHVAQGDLGQKAPGYPGSMYERRTHPEWVHVELEDNRVAIRAPLQGASGGYP